MRSSPARVTLNGAIAGLALAVGFVAWFGGWTAIETVTALPGEPGTVAATPTFVADADSMWLLVLFVGALGGAVIAMVASAAGRAREPDAPRFGLAWLLPIGLVLGAVLGYSVFRLGVTIGGQLNGSDVSVPVTTLVLVAAIAGIVAGGATAPIVDALARPASIGPHNEATPVSSRAFWLDTMGAIGVPVLAVVIIVGLAVSLAEVLLNAPSSVASVTVFAVVAALILAGTTLFATRPWDRSGRGES